MDPKALYSITYGLYLLTAREGERDNGCIINTAIQVANDPTRVSIACIKGNLTCEMVKNTGVFNISTINTDADFELFKRFGMQSGRDVDKFEGFSPVSRSENGLLYLTAASNAYLSGKVVDTYDLGSHLLFIAELTDAQVLASAPACTYAYYQSDIKPKPQTAKKKGYVCTVCGYVYEGDEIPDDYLCPLCKHGKEVFVPLEEKKAKKWVCTVCGYTHEGDAPPEICPLCKQPADKFKEV